MSKPEILPLTERFQDYLHDESRLTGQADAIVFPQDVSQAAAALACAQAQGWSVTVQGSRTGIVGGAVPRGGLILNLSHMTAIGPVTGTEETGFTVTVEPGVLWQDLDKALARQGLCFPPDPTETTASIGGMFAHNARGICSHRYGATADWVQAVQVLRPDGSLLEIERGSCVLDSTGCTLPDGSRLELGPLPTQSFAPCVPSPGLSLVDVFAGSEGTLGVVVRLTLNLAPRPTEPWGLTLFFDGPDAALSFADGLYDKHLTGLCCVEFYDAAALALVNAARLQSSQLKDLVAFPPESQAALYLQVQDPDADAVEDTLMALLDAFAAAGGSEAQSWAVSGESAIRIFRRMRHAVPEAVNAKLDALRQTLPGLYKLSMDFACPTMPCQAQYALYTRILKQYGVPAVVFGHAADRHLHCNLLPVTPEQLARCPQVLAALHAVFTDHGGILRAENGAGKLKNEHFFLTDGERTAAAALRQAFDPTHCMNPENFPTV